MVFERTFFDHAEWDNNPFIDSGREKLLTVMKTVRKMCGSDFDSAQKLA